MRRVMSNPRSGSCALCAARARFTTTMPSSRGRSLTRAQCPMSRFLSLLLAALVAASAAAQERYPGIGRAATPAEVRAWDIDVRPDFTGLPKGAGSVKKGEEVWEAKCASCHGAFGESNSVFSPIAGGTTQEDIAKGRVAALSRPDQAR